jgi:hypothetical protein
VNCREWYKLVVERQLGALNCYANSWRASRLYPRVDSRPPARHIALRYNTFLAQLGTTNRKGSPHLAAPIMIIRRSQKIHTLETTCELS